MSYPHERQIEYWTSRAIEEYFENQGYTVVVIPNSQHLEKVIPFDHLFAGAGIKVFGLQYKRLYPQPDHWRLERHQHGTLLHFDWTYYALTEVRTISEHRNALHLVEIVRPARMPNSCLPNLRLDSMGSGQGKFPYMRWGGFVQGLFACHAGRMVTSLAEIQDLLGSATDLADALVDIYLVTTGPKRVMVRSSPFVRSVGEEEMLELGLEELG